MSFDTAQTRHQLAGVQGECDLVLARTGGSVMTRWQALRQAVAEALEGGPVGTVHLHGLRVALWTGRVARQRCPRARVLVTSHRAASWLPLQQGVQASLGLAAAGTSTLTPAGLQPPVDPALFALARHEARKPLVLAGGLGRDSRQVDFLSQIAVLMAGDDEHRVAFNCLGELGASAQARLAACGVGLFPAEPLGARLNRLDSPWLALGCGPSPQAHRFLAEAMAAGLPCVSLEHAVSRELLQHGVTGFLCRDEQQVIEHVALLVDYPEVRHRMGEAARAHAREHLTEAAFARQMALRYEAPLHPLVEADLQEFQP